MLVLGPQEGPKWGESVKQSNIPRDRCRKIVVHIIKEKTVLLFLHFKMKGKEEPRGARGEEVR